MEPIMRSFGKAPAGGWLQNAYSFILGQLFPAKNTIDPSEDTNIARGRLSCCNFSRPCINMKTSPYLLTLR